MWQERVREADFEGVKGGLGARGMLIEQDRERARDGNVWRKINDATQGDMSSNRSNLFPFWVDCMSVGGVQVYDGVCWNRCLLPGLPAEVKDVNGALD